MNCHEVLALLDPLIDGELPMQEQEKLSIHLAQCPDCQVELNEMQTFQNQLKKAEHFNAPETLKSNIQNDLNNGTNKPKSFLSSFQPLLNSLLNTLFNPLTSHVGIALTSAAIVFILMSQPFRTSSIQMDVFNAHVQSLASNNLVSVISSDQHTVKPWFAGKVKFSPIVPDIQKAGFSLLGGRIDNIQDKDVAVITYQRRKHFINVFISPIEMGKKVVAKPWSHNGYNMVFWKQKDFIYSAISDISAKELNAFSNKMMTTSNLL